MSTPNGQKVQIMLEELHDVYGTEWTQTLMYVISTLATHNSISTFFDWLTVSPSPATS